MGYFAVADFYDCFLELLLPLCPKIEGAAVRLREPVGIAVNKGAFTFSSQETDLLLAGETLLFVDLDGFLLHRLLLLF